MTLEVLITLFDSVERFIRQHTSTLHHEATHDEATRELLRSHYRAKLVLKPETITPPSALTKNE